MVGAEFSLKQWEVSYILSSPVNNRLRCIFRRLWCILSGTQNRGHWMLSEKKDHISVLELRAAKYVTLTFTNLYSTAKMIHLKMDNIASLSYLVKMLGTHNQLLARFSKGIGEYLLDKGITITVEYLPGSLNRTLTCSHEP